jgi:serine/threonine-protein kinase HipA
MCQALGIHPTHKYESDGGPGARTIAELLRAQSSNPEEDIESFVDANILNWLIAGTDAHAKNYALLLGGGGAVRLAPVYDLASILPYQTVDLLKAKLAMKIGGEYRLRNIGLRHWKKFAVDLRLQEGWLIERIRAMAASLPDQAATVQNELVTAGLLHDTITRLSRRLKARASSCQKLLPGSDSAAG